QLLHRHHHHHLLERRLLGDRDRDLDRHQDRLTRGALRRPARRIGPPPSAKRWRGPMPRHRIPCPWYASRSWGLAGRGFRYHLRPAEDPMKTSPNLLAQRRHSVPVMVGTVQVGGDAPIVVQSMTNTDTADVTATTKQVAELARAGSELVRITVNTDEAAAAVPHIRDRLAALGVQVPLIGDFHFNGHKLLKEHPACAEALTKYRINPGNVGRGSKRDPQFAEMIEAALKYDKCVRIGV